MRQQFKNLDTWRGKLTATWVCLAPPTAMVAVFVVGGVTSNTFIVDAHALSAPRQDAVFDDLANNVPQQPGVDGSLPTQDKSTVQVPVTGTTDGTVQPIPGAFGNASGIPGTVLAAYQKAARDLAMSMPGCHITWPLLAARELMAAGVDGEALKKKFTPQETIDMTKETIEWVRARTPLVPKS